MAYRELDLRTANPMGAALEGFTAVDSIINKNEDRKIAALDRERKIKREDVQDAQAADMHANTMKMAADREEGRRLQALTVLNEYGLPPEILTSEQASLDGAMQKGVTPQQYAANLNEQQGSLYDNFIPQEESFRGDAIVKTAMGGDRLAMAVKSGDKETILDVVNHSERAMINSGTSKAGTTPLHKKAVDYKIIPDGPNKGMLAVQIETMAKNDKTGKVETYKDWLTVNRSGDPNDPVKIIDPAAAATSIAKKAYMTQVLLARRVALGDPEAWKEFKSDKDNKVVVAELSKLPADLSPTQAQAKLIEISDRTGVALNTLTTAYQGMASAQALETQQKIQRETLEETKRDNLRDYNLKSKEALAKAIADNPTLKAMATEAAKRYNEIGQQIDEINAELEKITDDGFTDPKTVKMVGKVAELQKALLQQAGVLRGMPGGGIDMGAIDSRLFEADIRVNPSQYPPEVLLQNGYQEIPGADGSVAYAMPGDTRAVVFPVSPKAVPSHGGTTGRGGVVQPQNPPPALPEKTAPATVGKAAIATPSSRAVGAPNPSVGMSDSAVRKPQLPANTTGTIEELLKEAARVGVSIPAMEKAGDYKTKAYKDKVIAALKASNKTFAGL